MAARIVLGAVRDWTGGTPKPLDAVRTRDDLADGIDCGAMRSVDDVVAAVQGAHTASSGLGDGNSALTLFVDDAACALVADALSSGGLQQWTTHDSRRVLWLAPLSSQPRTKASGAAAPPPPPANVDAWRCAVAQCGSLLCSPADLAQLGHAVWVHAARLALVFEHDTPVPPQLARIANDAIDLPPDVALYELATGTATLPMAPVVAWVAGSAVQWHARAHLHLESVAPTRPLRAMLGRRSAARTADFGVLALRNAHVHVLQDVRVAALDADTGSRLHSNTWCHVTSAADGANTDSTALHAHPVCVGVRVYSAAEAACGHRDGDALLDAHSVPEAYAVAPSTKDMPRWNAGAMQTRLHRVEFALNDISAPDAQHEHLAALGITDRHAAAHASAAGTARPISTRNFAAHVNTLRARNAFCGAHVVVHAGSLPAHAAALGRAIAQCPDVSWEVRTPHAHVDQLDEALCVHGSAPLNFAVRPTAPRGVRA